MAFDTRSTLLRGTAGLALTGALSALAVADFTYTDFSSTAGLNLVDDAAQEGTILRLAPALGWQRGAAWYATRQHFSDGFDTSFHFRITAAGNAGADGFAFVLQDMDPFAIGAAGGFMGYSSGYGPEQAVCGDPVGITHSLAIEFDTHYNPDFDEPSDNHVSVHTRGAEPNCAHHSNSLGSATLVSNLEDGAVHEARIRYMGGLLSIYVDDLATPAIEIPLDLETQAALTSGWAGFTAATGSFAADHDLLDWSFTPTCGATDYCASTANSTGLPAVLTTSGSMSVPLNLFGLEVAHCPANAFGVFFYGVNPAQYPLGDGILCVSPYAPGFIRLMPVVQAGLAGDTSMQLDFDTLPQNGRIEPGSTWHFQFWYRDTAAAASGSNLSNGLRVNFCP